ncbi:MAG: acetoacetate decarboxylase family protein [Acidimicrobiales bacterium]
MDAPGRWALSGECVVGVVGHRSGGESLPSDLHRVRGPSLVVAARYDVSPVGPYLELAVSEPARLGASIGMCVTTIVVTTADARRGGRANWGMPKELGSLDWFEEGDVRGLRWVERDVVLRGTPVGPPLPTLVPFRSLQHRVDGPVAAAASLRGLARMAKVEVEVADGDPLAWTAGRHAGAVVSSARLVMGEAHPAPGPRRPRPARRPALEPALSWGPQAGD